MTSQSLSVTAAILALAGVPAAAQQATFDQARIAQHVRTLSDDSFEGRAPSTRGEQMTVDYISKQFAAAGLQPGGEVVNGRRGWTQRVPLLKSDNLADPVVTIQSAGGGMRLTQGNEIAVRAPTNGQSQVRLTNAPIVFAGYGVSAPERQWDDFKGQDVRGKIIVVLVNDPDFEGGEGNFGGKAMTYYGRWTYKYEEAAKRGAAGVLIVHETVPASYGWATVKNSNTITMFDVVRPNPAAEHTPFESWIQRDTAVQLFRNAGLDFEAAKQAARRRDFQPMDLKATLSATLNAKTEVINSYNVAGMLPGRTRPDETIIYSAHHDHLGIGLPDANGDRIFNGAIDNATGVAHLIEQARAFAKRPRTQRSVVFLAVAAEEKGLLGTEYYVSNPLFPLARTAGILNTDVMGVNGRARDFSARGNEKFGLLDMVVAEGRRQGRTFTPDPGAAAGSFFRSDHFPFAKAGVPALSFTPGRNLIDGGTARGDALAADYTAKRYHQPDDEFDPNWNWSGFVQDAQLLHNVGYRLANSADWPQWDAGSEFRAIRDRSEGERGGPGAPAAPAPGRGERGR
ncbi:M28 family peptidase [Sphingomonas lutea]|uniref:M28 family peptidase n=1 Tax=Sphingomonas lutea TaxID=1045317 RepID=A0A7G9SKG8_9SPHN|nr:M28 family metallopeptidase [Sphingomonas lutea]QNN68343.1 M28 family peptidase [Sphingomonas lutea]